MQYFSLKNMHDSISQEKWPNFFPVLQTLEILNYGRCIPSGALTNKIRHYAEQFGFAENWYIFLPTQCVIVMRGSEKYFKKRPYMYFLRNSYQLVLSTEEIINKDISSECFSIVARNLSSLPFNIMRKNLRNCVASNTRKSYFDT